MPHAGSGAVFFPKLYCGVLSEETEDGEDSSCLLYTSDAADEE